jgi:nicotinamidase-related amidase
MIRGFTDPACDLGHECASAVRATQRLLATFRARRLPVFFTTVVYSTPEQASVFRRKLPALNLLTHETGWSEVDTKMQRRDSELIIEKQWASGFFQTNLNEHLLTLGVDSLVITGLTTSGCVRATAVDGLQYNYPVIVAEDAVSDRNPEAHLSNLRDLGAKYAEIETADTIIAEIEDQAH